MRRVSDEGLSGEIHARGRRKMRWRGAYVAAPILLGLAVTIVGIATVTHRVNHVAVTSAAAGTSVAAPGSPIPVSPIPVSPIHTASASSTPVTTAASPSAAWTPRPPVFTAPLAVGAGPGLPDVPYTSPLGTSILPRAIQGIDDTHGEIGVSVTTKNAQFIVHAADFELYSSQVGPHGACSAFERPGVEGHRIPPRTVYGFALTCPMSVTDHEIVVAYAPGGVAQATWTGRG